MKNEYSNGRLSYFFTPRIHGNVLAWITPASKSERSKQVTENILRWEDDGGPVSETAYSTPPSGGDQHSPVGWMLVRVREKNDECRGEGKLNMFPSYLRIVVSGLIRARVHEEEFIRLKKSWAIRFNNSSTILFDSMVS